MAKPMLPATVGILLALTKGTALAEEAAPAEPTSRLLPSIRPGQAAFAATEGRIEALVKTGAAQLSAGQRLGDLQSCG